VLVLRELLLVHPSSHISLNSLYVIRCADLIIDLGPEGGDKGGEILVCGTAEEVAAHPTSHTGRYLKQVLIQHPALPLAIQFGSINSK